MQILSIEVVGDDASALVSALDQIKRMVSERLKSGSNSNGSAKFNYEIFEKEED